MMAWARAITLIYILYVIWTQALLFSSIVHHCPGKEALHPGLEGDCRRLTIGECQGERIQIDANWPIEMVITNWVSSFSLLKCVTMAILVLPQWESPSRQAPHGTACICPMGCPMACPIGCCAIIGTAKPPLPMGCMKPMGTCPWICASDSQLAT